MNRSRCTDERGGSVRAVGRFSLAGLLAISGVGHLLAPEAFLAQVPPWLPGPGVVIFVSGVIELALAAALVLGSRRRTQIGWVVAAFFVLIFPGNLSQAITGADAFGLDSPTARWLRLAFQPLLVAWALWSTGAWRAWRRRRP
jgi:uncharacterized membrane protein